MFYGEHDVDDVRGDGVVFQDIPVHEVGGFVYQLVVRNAALADLSRTMVEAQSLLVALVMEPHKVQMGLDLLDWKEESNPPSQLVYLEWLARY